MTLPGIGRLSFGARIVIVLVAILLLMQLATLLIVDVAVNRDVHRQLAERIDVGDSTTRSSWTLPPASPGCQTRSV